MTDAATGVQRAVPQTVLDSPYELRGVAEYRSGHYIARVRFTSEDDLWWRMDDYPKTPRHTAVKDNLIAEALMAMYVAVDCLDQGDREEGQGARGGEQQREALVSERIFHNLRGTRDGAHE